MTDLEYYSFEVQEYAALCQNERKLRLLYHFIKGMDDQADRRPRTDEERKKRAEFMGLSPEEICR